MNQSVKFSIETENGSNHKRYTGTMTIEDDGGEEPTAPMVVHCILKQIAADPQGTHLLAAKRLTIKVAIL
jgi:hypothetical protein